MKMSNETREKISEFTMKINDWIRERGLKKLALSFFLWRYHHYFLDIREVIEYDLEPEEYEEIEEENMIFWD